MEEQRKYSYDMFLGIAVGDALGVPFEFKNREALKREPVTDMMGFGTYNQPVGTWSDDSSLAFCLADSLCNGYDLVDIAKKFVEWKDKALWTPYGEVFDIGITTSYSINKLRSILKSKNYDELKSLKDINIESHTSNGSLMRILPLLGYIKSKPIKDQFEIIREVSALTHQHIRSAIACLIYLKFAELIIVKNDKKLAYALMKDEVNNFLSISKIDKVEINVFRRILEADISSLPIYEIESTGYVIHTLESALWCVLKNDNYADTVLTAVNLGGDTDTISAIAGGLAGLIYSYKKIPEKWVSKLAKLDKILELAERYENKYFKAQV
ncbi:MAG: ADP-ribosylglycohydrolase family protein [Candidatus Woesearchaeota archaeon]